jgi:hypothetical protein
MMARQTPDILADLGHGGDDVALATARRWWFNLSALSIDPPTAGDWLNS